MKTASKDESALPEDSVGLIQGWGLMRRLLIRVRPVFFEGI